MRGSIRESRTPVAAPVVRTQPVSARQECRQVAVPDAWCSDNFPFVQAIPSFADMTRPLRGRERYGAEVARLPHGLGIQSRPDVGWGATGEERRCRWQRGAFSVKAARKAGEEGAGVVPRPRFGTD